jgi:hypothetical protein
MLKNNKVTFAGAGIALGLTALVSIAPQAQAATLNTGTTVGAFTWNRPVASVPPVLSSVATAVRYNSYGFTVSTPGSYTFQSTAVDNWDNYTFLYQKAFNPASPLTGYVTGNDDFIPNTPTSGSEFTTNLDPGTNYFFVTTGFNNGDFGAFTNTITGVGTASAIASTSVPEPATILGTLAAFGYGAYSRRKIKLAGAIDKKTV